MKAFERRESKNTQQTFTAELESIERMLRQIELSLIAGDHEPYKTSASAKIHRSSCYQTLKDIAKHRSESLCFFLTQANVTVAVNMRMEWSWMLKDNLWSFHRIMLRKFHLKLVSFIGIKGSWSSINFNDPSFHTKIFNINIICF